MSRQQNVQQQNEETERSLRRVASHWRREGVPEALTVHGEQRGIEWSRTIVVSLDIDFPGMPQLVGLLLTQDEQFISFELNTDEAHQIVESVDEWADVTATQNLDLRNRGTGAGYGALAIKILHELNSRHCPLDFQARA